MQLTLENIVVGMCMIGYILVGSSFLYKGNIPWAITWLSYGMANVGLIWAQSQSQATTRTAVEVESFQKGL